ncbi:MAG: hypothetical protein Q4E71_00835 [Prevotella sp.]|nr:hypothetical protein [Prevotella sp.]
MKLTEQQIKMMQEEMYAQLIELLIKRHGVTMDTAINMFYNSDAYDRLADKNTGLYFQSPGYVYSYLNDEITRGKF